MGSGLPYFYDEDEAHHFNRQVQMLQTGELNPKYFLKPSLNFYLRLPAISAGFLWSVKKEQARSIKDIRTKDTYGISGYNFTSSHPATLKANRLFSIGIGLLIIVAVYYLTLLLTRSPILSVLSSLLTSLAPLSLEYSASIGVNQPTALFCLLTILAATLYYRNPRIRTICLSAIFAGLAISTKYNALPIILVPLVSCILVKPSLWKIFIATIAPWIAFIAASPYILKELPLFLDHLAFEVWHYGVAGHINHQAEPGLSQLLYYLSRLSIYDLGIIPLTIAFVGIAYGLQKKNHDLIPLVVFLFGYLALMISQKANFNRNLLLILPLIPVLTVIGLQYLFLSLKAKATRVCLIVLVLIQPLVLSIYQIQKSKTVDSRTEAFNYLHSTGNPNSRLAVDGNLWLPKFTKQEQGKEILTRPGTNRVNLKKEKLIELFLQGYQEVLVPGYLQLSNVEKNIVSTKMFFPGDLEKKRVVNNPEIQLLTFNQNEIFRNLDQLDIAALEFQFKDNLCYLEADKFNEFWLDQKIYYLDLHLCLSAEQNRVKLSFKYFSPWIPQKLSLVIPEEFKVNFPITQQEDYLEIELGKKELNLGKLYLVIDQINSPQELGLSSDNRNLGIKILAKN